MSDLQPLTIQDGYIVLPVTTDPNVLVQQALAAIAEALPGWIPSEGQLEVILLEQFAQMAAESAQVAALVPLAIFQYFGTLVGIEPETGAQATALSNWTMVDTQGYSVPAGAVVAYQPLGNVQVEFQTVNGFTVSPGGNTAVNVEIQAVVVGSAGNGVPGGIALVPVSQLSFVQSVGIVAGGPSSGGADPESVAEYLNRLSTELQLLTPRPILPNDFAALAGQVSGVYRALALNGLSPGRSVLNAVIVNGSVDINDPAEGWTNSDVGRPVVGTGIPSAATISSVLTAGRSISGAVVTSSSATLNDPAGSFLQNDVGRPVVGTGIPSGTTVLAFTNANNVTMTAEATAGVTETVTLGALANCLTAVMSAPATASETETIALGDLYDQIRTCTIAAVDVDGNALSGPVQAALSAYMEAQRETNFRVPVISPTYSLIDVGFSATALPGQNAANVQAAAIAAITDYLSPSNWGTETTIINGTLATGSDTIVNATIPSSGPGAGIAIGQPISGFGIPEDTTITDVEGTTITMSNNATVTGTAIITVSILGTWSLTSTYLRYIGLLSVLVGTPGIDVSQPIALTFGIDGGTISTGDLALPGDAPLTQPNDIVGTVLVG